MIRRITSMEINKKKYYQLVIPFLILTINLVIKYLYIDNRDIAGDEPFSIYWGQMSMKSIIDMLYNENNPPLHFFILHFIIKLFGVSALSVRIPSLIFSSLTAVIIYKIGSKYFTHIIGIGASLIFSFSTMHIFFSHEARVYPLFSLLTACLLYVFLGIIKNPSNRSNFYALFVLNVLLIYSHYFGIFVLFMEVFSLLIITERKQLLKPLALVMATVVISYIPILFIFTHRLGVTTGNGTWVTTPGLGEIYGNLNRFLNTKYNMLVLIILLLAATISLTTQNKLKYQLTELFKNIYFKTIFSWFIVPYLTMFLVSFKVPMFVDRYILYTSIPFFLIIAVVLHYFFVKTKFIAIALSIFLIGQTITMQINPDNNRRLKEVARIVSILKKEQTITFLAPDHAFMGFCYYYNLKYFMQAPNTINLLNTDRIFPINKKETALEIITKNTNHDKRPSCIYVQAGTEFIDPENGILKAIESQYQIHKVVHVFEIYDIHYFYN